MNKVLNVAIAALITWVTMVILLGLGIKFSPESFENYKVRDGLYMFPIMGCVAVGWENNEEATEAWYDCHVNNQ